MEWKDISSTVGKIAPALGALLAVPTGGASIAIGQAIAAVLGSDSTPEAVAHAIANNPDAALKLQAMENEHKQAMKQLEIAQEKNQLDAQTSQSADINKTMQSEAVSEHLLTYSWRPLIGYAIAIDLVVSVIVVAIAYIGVIFFRVDATLLSHIPSFLGAMAALVGVAAPIVGIASYFRGKMQADPNIPTVNRG